MALGDGQKKMAAMLAPLASEAALLERLLYRNRSQLRRDRHYQRLERVVQCVDRLLDMHLPDLCDKLASAFPPLPSGTASLNGKDLPAPSVLLFAFHRFSGAVTLLDATVDACEAAAAHTLQCVAKQLFVPFNVTAVAITSRLDMCARVLRNTLWALYDRFFNAVSAWSTGAVPSAATVLAFVPPGACAKLYIPVTTQTAAIAAGTQAVAATKNVTMATAGFSGLANADSSPAEGLVVSRSLSTSLSAATNVITGLVCHVCACFLFPFCLCLQLFCF